MSLLRSIFGEAPTSAQTQDKQNEIANLFASNVSVPVVPPHKKAVTEKPRENTSDDDQSTNSDPALLQPDFKDAEVVSPNKSTARKTKEQLKEEEERTIFVGNLPPEITRRSLAVLFKRCGTIASARLRSIAVSGVKLPPEQAGNQVTFVRAFDVFHHDFLTDFSMKPIMAEHDAESVCQHRESSFRI